ncbi:MAG TPA: 5'-3' exonuclease H3TH domain-containing protein [Polyangiaceae bacterium]|nr:5'-3' exonuclease H3TH domain-containing protein [Polyangiaceae bacterium]
MTTALLLDVYSLFFRAFHALPPMSTRAGEPTSALYGLFSVVLKLLREQPGAALAFALDAPQATFRHQEFAEYKAGRAATPADLSAQFERLSQLLDALAVPVHRCPGFEADDVLSTLAKRARDRAEPALVVSGDRDLLQLAHGSVRVYFVGRRGKDAVVYDEEQVQSRFGVPPTRLPSYVGLVGDASDNLPGVPGIGAATARKLLATRQNCSELLAELATVDSVRLRDTLHQHHSQILRTEQLATLRDDAPISAADPLWAAPSASALRALATLFEELEFKSLLTRLESLLARHASCS